MNRRVTFFALSALIVLVAATYASQGMTLALAAMIGGGAGLALYHASFGFTAAWRRLVLTRQGAGIRAQMLLLGLTSLIFFPILVYGDAFGIHANGYISPMGVGSALGAFAFGIGMQLGGGCASGTLFTVGGGSTRMVFTLVGFIAGSVWATFDLGFWNTLPLVPAISLPETLGVVPALLLIFALLGLIWFASIHLERKAHGTVAPIFKQSQAGHWLKGPWSPATGALALVVICVATFLVLGRPWGVTWGFALWGAKFLDVTGFDIASTPFWSGGANAALNAPLLADGTTVMNFGIIFGAMLAAALAGKWQPLLRITPREILIAVIGGLLMGYGARIAYGCNIGAYLGGITSGSLHGWYWLIFAFGGSSIGAVLRVKLGMEPASQKQPIRAAAC